MRYVFNPITLQYEVREEPRYTRYVRTALTIAVAAGLCVLYFWLYTSVLGWDLPKTARLKKENARWQSKIAVAERQMDINWMGMVRCLHWVLPAMRRQRSGRTSSVQWSPASTNTAR